VCVFAFWESSSSSLPPSFVDWTTQPTIFSRASLTLPFPHLPLSLLAQDQGPLLIKTRLAIAANSNAVAPSCLQGRAARTRPLPRVALVPLTNGQNDGEDDDGGKGRKLRTALAFMCGLGREGMPAALFGMVMNLLMPSWDSLYRPVQEGRKKRSVTLRCAEGGDGGTFISISSREVRGVVGEEA